MTTTAGLGITLLEARQTQPHIVVNEAISNLDAAVSGRLARDLTGLATLTLTNEEASTFIINPYGTPTGDFTLITNGNKKAYLIINDTSFKCSFGAATGVKVEIYPGKTLHCYFDGTNMHSITENDTGWIDFTLAAGWTNTGGSWASLSYRKVGDFIYLRGQVDTTTGTTNRTIATLPTGFRPSVKKQIIGISSTPSGAAILEIATTGEITYQGSTATLTRLSLDGTIV